MGELLVSAIFWQHALKNPSLPPKHSPPPPPQEKSLFKYHQMRFGRSYTNPEHISNRFLKTTKKPLFTPKKIAQKPIPTKRKNTTLIFAPHPDDEILCCSQTIREKLAQGEDIKVIYLTDGGALGQEPAHKARAYAKIRRHESQKAARILGLKQTDLFFLGFPDGHLHDLTPDQIVRSTYTNRIKSSSESHFGQTLYRRDLLVKNLAQILKRFHPQEVFVPSPEKDFHPDHQETTHLVTEALQQTHMNPEVYAYVVHNLKAHQHALPHEKKDPWKLELIRLFASQFHDAYHRLFMEQFASKEEIFEPLDIKLVQQ